MRPDMKGNTMKVTDVKTRNQCKCGAAPSGSGFYKEVENSEVEFVCEECWWKYSVLAGALARLQMHGVDILGDNFQKVILAYIENGAGIKLTTDDNEQFAISCVLSEVFVRKSKEINESRRQKIETLESEIAALKKERAKNHKRLESIAKLESENQSLKRSLDIARNTVAALRERRKKSALYTIIQLKDFYCDAVAMLEKSQIDPESDFLKKPLEYLVPILGSVIFELEDRHSRVVGDSPGYGKRFKAIVDWCHEIEIGCNFDRNEMERSAKGLVKKLLFHFLAKKVEDTEAEAITKKIFEAAFYEVNHESDPERAS